MSSDVKRIALYLNAAGFTAKDKDTSYILKEVAGNLIEQKFIDTNQVDEIFIAEGVKPNTSAVYIDRDYTHMIVYVTQSNNLACVQRLSSPNDDEPVWDKAPLAGISPVTIYERSRIAGINSVDSTLVFFQHPDGSIRSIMYDEETKQWMDGDFIQETAQVAYPGTPLYVTELENVLGVFYLTNGRTVGGQLQDYETNEWRDCPIGESRFESGISNLIVVQDGECNALHAYLHTAGGLIHIDGSGKTTTLGNWDGETFIPEAGAECGLIIGIIIVIFGFIVASGLKGRGGHSRRRHHYRRLKARDGALTVRKS